MEQPIVSVVIPAYNCAGYIVQALESAFAQEVPLEVLVIDDGSQDGLLEVLRPYLGRPDFRYFCNAVNLGAAGSRNRGVQKAAGTYVAFLDADDWWENGKLAAQLELLSRTGDVLCATGRELVREDGTSAGRVIPVKENITYRELLKHNSINCSSVVIRRDVALEFPMERDDIHEDYLTWLKVLQKYGRAVGINRPYLKYRLRREGKSADKLRSAVMTYKVYRCMGYGRAKSALFFASYAVHGLQKYGGWKGTS